MTLIQYLKEYLDYIIANSINAEDLKRWSVNVISLFTSLIEYNELPEDSSISICYVSDTEIEITYKNGKGDEVTSNYKFPSLEADVFYNEIKVIDIAKFQENFFAKSTFRIIPVPPENV